MIKEFRFKGNTPQGRLAQGTVNAHNMKKAKEKIYNLAKKYNLNITDIEQKRIFLYTIYLPNKKKIKGKQAAYTKEEVAEGLKNMGYTDFKITPVLFDIQMKPSKNDIQMFIKLSTNMLQDKMNFGQVLSLLAEEQSNSVLKETLYQIEKELKQGAEGKEVFKKYTDVFGKFPAFMLGLATQSGNMAKIFDATNTFIERDSEIKKNIKKALISPMFAVFATIGAVMYYVIEIFPSTTKMFVKLGIEVPPMTQSTLELSDWLGANYLYIIAAFVIPVLIIWRWWSTPSGKVWRDRFIIKLPIIGHLIHKTSIEIFFRVFATVYAGASDNIETILISAEACRNKYIEKMIKTVTVPLMLEKGEAFVPAMQASGVFPRSVISRLKSGSETGNVLKPAQQIASYFEAETSYKMSSLIEFIQTIIVFFITIVITMLTIVSAEISTVSPPASF